jgi:hypothetical protein
MKNTEPQRLWAQLREAGLVDGELPATSDAITPWYIRTMLGIAGWIGALFLLGFVGAGFAFVMKSVAASLLLGTILCASAATLFRVKSGNDFASQFAFALSLAGQALILAGLAQEWRSHFATIAFVMAAVEAALFLLIPNFLHRVWTATSGIYAAVLVLNDFGLHAYTLALLLAAFTSVWLNEFSHPRRASLFRALGYGLALVALFKLLTSGVYGLEMLLGGRHAALSLPGGALGPWIGAGLIGAVLLTTVQILLSREGVAATSGPGRAALAAAAILALISLKAPGIGLTLTILLVGHAHGNRVLAGLGIIGLLAYLSHYYYALDFTLLEKSALMAASGTALLGARLALRHLWPESGEEEKLHA